MLWCGRGGSGVWLVLCVGGGGWFVCLFLIELLKLLFVLKRHGQEGGCPTLCIRNIFALWYSRPLAIILQP